MRISDWSSDVCSSDLIGVLANRCEPDQLDDVCEQLARLELPSWALPETPLLSAPIVGDVMTALDGALLLGDERHLGREAEHMLVFAMSTEHVLERLRDGQLCIAAGDRPEALITLAAAHAPDRFPALARVVLNGGYRTSDQVLDLAIGR